MKIYIPAVLPSQVIGMVSRKLLIAVLLILGFSLLVLPGVSAKTHWVEIEGFEFKPEDITIEVGDTITWENNDSATHTATEDDDAWDTGDISGSGGTGSIVFNSAANWSYYCEYHPSMTGTVNVNAPPELENGTMDPSSGDRTTMFNFTVDYIDENNNTPMFVYVNIDGTNHTMMQVDGMDTNYTNGAEFYYETKLGGGTHTYRFYANDHYVTNSTAAETTGTVIPEFGFIIAVTMLAVVGIATIGWRRRTR